jgi:hypothetical protein
VSAFVSPNAAARQVFTKETLHKGQPARIRCIDIGGQTFALGRGPLTILALEDEWYEDLPDPHAVIAAIDERRAPRPDLFTFWQRIPDVEPHFPFHCEFEDIAALPVSSYDHWWKHQIKSRVRNLIRNASKQGVVVKRVPFDDAFVAGITAIFNETPVRQGRRFWHFGKDFETVKRQFSRFVFREHMIGAYYRDEMIGFMMLGNAGRFGLTGQIISSIAHRDKAPNNALMAKAVEVCEAEKLGHLVYLYWSDGSLAEFKRRCGFLRVRVPRYYVPLTWKGRLALQCRAHHGLKAMLPNAISQPLKRARSAWLAIRTRRAD